MGFRLSTEKARKKAREEALREYESGWSMRPVPRPPDGLLDALRQEARELAGLRALTLAEARDSGRGTPYFLVGVRMAKDGPLTYAQARARLEGAVRPFAQAGAKVRFTELDAEVDPTMSDGTRNPYLVFGGP